MDSKDYQLLNKLVENGRKTNLYLSKIFHYKTRSQAKKSLLRR